MPFLVNRVAVLPVVALAIVVLSSSYTIAQDVANDAMFVTVPNPISSDAVKRIQNQVTARVNDAVRERQVRTVVFDFNPDGKPATSTDFGPCFDLAEFISKLTNVKTIAFVHSATTGHTVLPVIACKELVMSKAGVVGPVVVDGVPPLDVEVRQAAYKTKFQREDRWPIVQKMFDPAVSLVKGRAKVGGAPRFANANNPESLAQVAGTEPVKGVQDNQLANYPANVAREVELASGFAETRKDVAELYNLPPSVVRDDPLGGRSPAAYQWTLKGDVDGAMKESVNRIIRDVRKKKGNILILVLNCGGTDLDAARGLAEDLAKAQTGDDALLIIGFIPESAPDAGTIVALGCSEIVMTKPKGDGDAKEAELANFDRYLRSSKPSAIDAQRKSLRQLAEERGYPAVLIDAMLSRDLEVVRAKSKENRGKTKLMTREDLTLAQKNNDGWDFDKTIKPAGVPFRINATLAAELGLARFTIASKDVKEVCAIYGVGDAKSPDPGLIDKFAEFLRIPAVTIILVMIGFIGLILELKVPGLTVPGIVAALCFVLVFWSQSRFSGEMFVLALLLFILGLVLVGIEIFVLPGFGACGIFGILCMLGGLGLVTVERIPQNTSEWVGLGVRISSYLFAMMGAMVMAFLIAKFLPQVPYANRMMLAPPSDQVNDATTTLPGASEAAELLGAIGTTTTGLRPAGVVRFGEKFVDVVSEGGFIPTGARVQVIAVEATRIVVKEV
jgi:membrane-bound ClpP family serine protease